MNAHVDEAGVHNQNQRSIADGRIIEETELEAIMEGLAESVANAPDEELMQEATELGLDPLKEAEEVRRVLLDAVDANTPREVVTVQLPVSKRQ